MKTYSDQVTKYGFKSDSADTFETKTNLLRSKQMLFVLLGFVGIPVIIGVVLHNFYIGCFFLLCSLFGVVYWVIMKSYTLYFSGNRINIVGKLRKQNFLVYDIPASDLIVSQTKKQEENNSCDIRIVGTIFILYSVEKCDELKKYINTHFE